MSRLLRRPPMDDPMMGLAAGVWAAALGFAAGFIGYLGLAPI